MFVFWCLNHLGQLHQILATKFKHKCIRVGKIEKTANNDFRAYLIQCSNAETEGQGIESHRSKLSSKLYIPSTINNEKDQAAQHSHFCWFLED